jgi:GT2 family glycosyltransferase
MKIYVVIPHYILNDHIAELAKNAIASFKKYPVTVVSVDDGSPMGMECLKDSDVIIPRVNGGFAKACNTGFKYVLEQNEPCWVVCANNDIEVSGNWIEEAQRCFDQFQADMVGGLGYRIKEFPKRDENFVTEGGQLEDFMFPGGFYITTDAFLREIGQYDEKYEHGGIEDIDLFYRAKKAHKRLIMTPKIKYWHEEGATRYSETQKGKQSEAIKRNEDYFEKKWGFDPIRQLNTILRDNRLNP